jgi:hypothetical protein
VQALPLEKTGLQYVEDTARAHDPSITLERCRQALGALGITASMVNQPIGETCQQFVLHLHRLTPAAKH